MLSENLQLYLRGQIYQEAFEFYLHWTGNRLVSDEMTVAVC